MKRQTWGNAERKTYTIISASSRKFGKNEVDFSLVSFLPDTLQIEKVPLMENTLYLVGNMAQTFDGKMQEIRIFENLPLIYREKGSATRQVMENFIPEKKLPIHKEMALTSNEVIWLKDKKNPPIANAFYVVIKWFEQY